MMYRSSVIAILVILGLLVNVALAVICFEGTPLETFQGTYYSFSGEESDGKICVNVTREEDDVNRSNFESFRCVVSEVATPIFGGATAAAGVDFTPTPSGGSSVSFPQNSTVTELCVDVFLDDTACENPEDFRIRLISLNPVISTMCSTEAIVTIRDSTTITVGFTTSTTSVRENAPEVSLSVTRSSGIQNFNIAELSVMEDPDQGGCIAAPGRISYPCIAQQCVDGTTIDLTKDVVSSVTLSLVPDDSEIDGHRECRILLKPQQGSICKFNITRGRTQLCVRDDEYSESDIKISFEEFSLTVDESVGVVELRLVADKVVEGELWVNLSTQDETAKSGSDYILLNQSARFPSNSSISDPVLVQILDSSCFEPTERFSISLNLSCPGVMQGRYPNLTIVIKDLNVINVSFLDGNVSKHEGKLVKLKVARSGCIAQSISIGVCTNSTSGNASKDEDYRLKTREITFRKVNRANEKKTVVVKLLKDGNPEPQQSFYICLSTLNGVVYNRQHVQVLIKDRN